MRAETWKVGPEERVGSFSHYIVVWAKCECGHEGVITENHLKKHGSALAMYLAPMLRCGKCKRLGRAAIYARKKVR